MTIHAHHAHHADDDADGNAGPLVVQEVQAPFENIVVIDCDLSAVAAAILAFFFA
jgi:hypothetical protein